MNTMTYKGYLGSVAYSEKDNVFFGKIEGTGIASGTFEVHNALKVYPK